VVGLAKVLEREKVRARALVKGMARALERDMVMVLAKVLEVGWPYPLTLPMHKMSLDY